MQGIAPLDLAALSATTLRLAVAFVLGGLIGIERQVHQRIAGFRTNVLVALGASAFVDIAVQLEDGTGGARVVGNVVAGIGFLGAGAIMKEGATIHGLNTAATVWCSAAVGSFAGAGLLPHAVALTGFVLACNVLLRPLTGQIDRQPFASGSTEARYVIHLAAAADAATQARELLADSLSRAGLAVREITTQSFSPGQIEHVAQLVGAPRANADLDRLVERLSASPLVIHAAWHAHAGGPSG